MQLDSNQIQEILPHRYPFLLVDKIKDFVLSFKGFAIFIYILLQFLQVTILPFPAVIMVGAGVLLFGPFWGAIYSCIGIITGSLVAYFTGRIFGVKVVGWLIGKNNLTKGLNLVKGRDRVLLTFMFLFPFFPDDILCFVAGITTVKPIFFSVMIFVVRTISVFTSSYSINNNLIPYNTWWGIVLWGLFIVLTFVIAYLLCKRGDVVENKISKLFKNNVKHK